MRKSQGTRLGDNKEIINISEAEGGVAQDQVGKDPLAGGPAD